MVDGAWQTTERGKNLNKENCITVGKRATSQVLATPILFMFCFLCRKLFQDWFRHCISLLLDVTWLPSGLCMSRIDGQNRGCANFYYISQTSAVSISAAFSFFFCSPQQTVKTICVLQDV